MNGGVAIKVTMFSQIFYCVVRCIAGINYRWLVSWESGS